MDLLMEGFQRAVAVVGTAANAAASVFPKADRPDVLALLIGAMLADVLIEAARKLRRTAVQPASAPRSDWGKLVISLLWLLLYGVMFVSQAGESRRFFVSFVSFVGFGVVVRIVGPPIARALGLYRILVWVTAPLTLLTRSVGRLLAVIARPFAYLLRRLPRPSPFQFAMGATLAGCAVLTGLLVKTLLRL